MTKDRTLSNLPNSLRDMAFEDDAPSDGKQYVRENGDWVAAPSGDPLRDQIEAASGGLMTIRRDVYGNPSHFWKIPKMTCEELDPSGSLGYGTHPAFIFDGAEDPYILVAAYQAANIEGVAVSQPGRNPWVNINYDNARAACRAAGPGFDIISNLDWAVVSLWCMANGFQPEGNTASSAARPTGSGGAPWNHNNQPLGIADMTGNVWEWCSGLQLKGTRRAWLSPDNGKTEDADLIDSGFDLPAASANAWATTVNPAGASDLVRQSLVAPASGGMRPIGALWTATGDRVAVRGGCWLIGLNAGLAALCLSYARSGVRTTVVFRARFRDPEFANL